MARTFNKKTWIINALRRASFRYPPAIKAIKKSKTDYYIKAKNGNDVKRVDFTCVACKKSGLKRTQVNLDHVVPVVGPEGFVDWNTYIERMFCDEDNFQIICSECHTKKSLKENEERAAYKTSHPKSEDEHVPNFKRKRRKK